MALHPKKLVTLSSWLLLIISISVSSFGQQNQNSDFDVPRLSPRGRTAYHRLLVANVFSVGGVGWGAATSQEELALYDLLDEQDSVASLKGLVRDASFEGGLYGLLGLRIRDTAEFNRAVQIYISRKNPPPRDLKNPFSGSYLLRDEVITASGCLIFTQDRVKVVANIQAGQFDEMLHRKQTIKPAGKTPFKLIF